MILGASAYGFGTTLGAPLLVRHLPLLEVTDQEIIKALTFPISTYVDGHARVDTGMWCCRRCRWRSREASDSVGFMLPIIKLSLEWAEHEGFTDATGAVPGAERDNRPLPCSDRAGGRAC